RGDPPRYRESALRVCLPGWAGTTTKVVYHRACVRRPALLRFDSAPRTQRCARRWRSVIAFYPDPMNPRFSPSHGRVARSFFFVLALAFGVLVLGSARAQSGNTGSISGRVLNPTTREYVRNAEVSARGGTLTAITDEDGAYTLTN